MVRQCVCILPDPKITLCRPPGYRSTPSHEKGRAMGFFADAKLLRGVVVSSLLLLAAAAGPTNQCGSYGAPPKGYVCHSDTCIGVGGHCGRTLAEPKLNLSGGCNFTHANSTSLAACVMAAANECDAQPGCHSFALDPKWHGSAPATKLFADASLTPKQGWDAWVRVGPAPIPSPPPPGPPPNHGVADLPIAYLGSASESDFDRLCRFQVVAVIDSPCWSNASAPVHSICTNDTNEEGRIIEISGRLKQRCPAVSAQMYLNSLMDFYWYDLHKEFEGANAAQLLHDAHGLPVTVEQDGGAGPQPVWDWGQAITRNKYMALVDRALASGIDSFFLDKASTSTKNHTQLCNHVCANLSKDVGLAWDAGHLAMLQAIAKKSPGPTVGNTGFGTCEQMGGCVQERALKPSQASIKELSTLLARPGTKAVFVHFPMSTAGYAAFLMAHQHGKSWFWWYNGKPTYSGWLPEFEHSIGTPVGAAKLDGSTGVYSRTFSSGAVVTFDTKSNQGQFRWPS